MKLFEFVPPCSMFSFTKNFPHKKSLYKKKKSTSGNPTLHLRQMKQTTSSTC